MTNSAPTTDPDAPRWRTPAIIGGVLVLAAIAGALLALVLTREPATTAADPSPSAPASPSEEPVPSEEPAPSEAPSAPAEPSEEAEGPYLDPVIADPDGVLPPGGVVRVSHSLRVRDNHFLSSPERVTLAKGDLLVVGPTFANNAFGPAMEDGYVWYPVGVLGLDELPAPGGDPLQFVATGWAAIGDGDTEWLEPIAPRCTDDEPTLRHLSSLTEWERLACYGDRQLTFNSVVGCPGCGGLVAGRITPEWLAYPLVSDLISVEPQEFIGPMDLHWSPEGPERPDLEGPAAPILRVTGHFDDPAAEGCSIVFMGGDAEGLSEDEVDPATSEHFCRTNFVVDSYEVIGEDEDFPLSG